MNLILSLLIRDHYSDNHMSNASFAAKKLVICLISSQRKLFHLPNFHSWLYNYHVHDHLLWLWYLKGGYHHKVETDLQRLVPVAVGKYSRKYMKYLRYVTMPKKTHTLVSAKHLSIVNRGAPVFLYAWLKTTTHWSISTYYTLFTSYS